MMGQLSFLLLLPLLGVFLITFLGEKRAHWARWVALIFSGATLVLAWSLLFGFDVSTHEIQYFEQLRWNPKLGTSFSLGLDGFSLPMVMLATLLCMIAILASSNIQKSIRSYYMLVLVLESAMLGVFVARDWSLFYLFWEMTLIPLFFLIDRWGGANRHGAALNFVLYTMGGSVFMLISLLVLFDYLPGHSFSMDTIDEAAKSLPERLQVFILLGLLIGFGVKMPIFPLHGWLPLAHVEAPSPISILLSGILLKMGAYGIIRAASALPAGVSALQSVLAVLGVFSVIYGGLLAWRQSDLKRMIAYSSVSHMGVVLIGIATMNYVGLIGATMQMVAHGLVAGALFLLIGLLYERTHTREVTHYSSLVRIMPRFAFFTIFAFIAAVALPGTAGFIAELHILIGSFAEWGWAAVLLSIGVLISATYAVRTVSRLFTGPVRSEMRDIQDLRPTEFLAATVLTLGIFLLGLFPAEALKLSASSASHLSDILGVVK